MIQRFPRECRLSAALALLLLLLYAALDAAGLRADVGVLSGTRPPSAADLLLGLLYALSWFAAVLAAPILLTASALGTLVALVRPGRGQGTSTLATTSKAGGSPAIRRTS